MRRCGFDLLRVRDKLPLNTHRGKRLIFMVSWTPEELRAHEQRQAKPDAVRSVDSAKRERSPVKALEPKPQRLKSGKGCLRLVVTLISCRRGELDHDNLVAGCKPLRDAVARSLGVDDADPRIKWCYGQARTDGETGTIVRIEVL